MNLEGKIIKKLKEIKDPHTGKSVYDMNMIENLEVKEDKVRLNFRPTSPFCPIGIQLATAIKKGLKEIEEIKSIDLKVVGYVKEKEVNEILKKI
ncbi:MAG: iron-sulfur cluster assembly protein [Candidatus Hydrothermarchaeota archaeon]